MFSKAIFLNSLLVKFSSWSNILSLLYFIIGLPIMFAMLFGSAGTSSERILDALSPLITGPMLPMFISYMFIQDTVANSKSLSTGEYLALLFTRPLSRFSYVMSKWLAGSLGVIIIVSLQALVFEISLRAMGVKANILDAYGMASLILNSFSYSALVICIYAFPARLGLVLFLGILYVSLLGVSFSTQMASVDNSGWGAFYNGLMNFFSFCRESLLPSIDVYAICTSLKFSWVPVVTYISNIALYLLVGSVVISQREFFYATE